MISEKDAADVRRFVGSFAKGLRKRAAKAHDGFHTSVLNAIADTAEQIGEAVINEAKRGCDGGADG